MLTQQIGELNYLFMPRSEAEGKLPKPVHGPRTYPRLERIAATGRRIKAATRAAAGRRMQSRAC